MMRGKCRKIVIKMQKDDDYRMSVEMISTFVLIANWYVYFFFEFFVLSSFNLWGMK